MTAGSAVSKSVAQKIGATGCIVIDNSSFWRYHPDVPLVVPEVNAHVLDAYMARNDRKNIIANPNCSTAQLVVALKPLHDLADDQARRGRDLPVGLRRRQGRHGRALDQTKGIFVNDQPTPKKFPKQIAFNVIPHIDVFMEDGSTKEEWKMVVETKKILDPKIKVTATCVRVPVFVGHSEAVNIEFEKPITADEARDILREAPGCIGDRQARAGRLHHADRSVRRVRHLCQPHPRGCDGRERPRRCGSSRTICARARRSTPCRSPRR